MTVFWSLNGLEMFGVLGRDRAQQITLYITALGQQIGFSGDSLLISPIILLTTLGVIELSLALLAVAAIIRDPRGRYLSASIWFSIAIFSSFIVGDFIVAGLDPQLGQSELLQHTLYFSAFSRLATIRKINRLTNGSRRD